jgi:membrane associated rhomboid family serine protease
MMRLTEVVKALMFANVAIFFVVSFNLIPFLPNLRDYFVLLPIGGGFEFYQVLTHMFMHGDINHLLFNMLTLFFIGPLVEQSLGANRFIFLYISAGIASAALHLFLTHNAAVGASGAIYGVLVAFATMYPNMKMMVFPIPFEIKAKYLIGAYVVYDLYSGLFVNGSGIAHFAHLGGAIAGFIIIYSWGMAKLH